MYELQSVATMQSDTRFVKDVKATHQRTAKRCGEIDALTFSARESVRRAIESEISQAYIKEKFQSGVNLREQTLCHVRVMLCQLEIVKP